MNWIKRMASARFGPSDSVSNSAHWLLRGFGGLSDAGVTVSEYTAMNVPAVYAAISRIADAIGMLPWHVYQAGPGGRAKRVADHPVGTLLGTAGNRYVNAFTQRQVLTSHTLGWGNGYLEIEMNRRGETTGLWNLLPDVTRPARKDGELYYQTVIDGQSFELGADRVAHIKALGHDGYLGYSPIGLFRNAIGMAVAMEKFGGKFFANDARSGGFIQHPLSLSPQAQKNLSDSVNAQGGLDNAHRIKVLEEGAKFVPTTINPDDAQFLGTRSFQIAEIARIYNVPLTLLQEPSGTSNWGSGIEQLMIGFITYTLGPWIKQIELEYDRKLFTEAERARGLYVKCSTSALLRGDMAARVAFYRGLMEIGALTAEEVRDYEDLPFVPDLDEHWRPANWIPAREPAPSATAAPASPMPAAPAATPAPAPAEADAAEDPEDD